MSSSGSEDDSFTADSLEYGGCPSSSEDDDADYESVSEASEGDATATMETAAEMAAAGVGVDDTDSEPDVLVSQRSPTVVIIVLCINCNRIISNNYKLLYIILSNVIYIFYFF